jgi:exonuclease I
MRLLFFDTETTGVKNWKNPNFIPVLVQLGAILQDMDTGRVLSEVNLIQTPDEDGIPKAASDVHGITDQIAIEVGVDEKIIDMIFAAFIKRDE